MNIHTEARETKVLTPKKREIAIRNVIEGLGGKITVAFLMGVGEAAVREWQASNRFPVPRACQLEAVTCGFVDASTLTEESFQRLPKCPPIAR